MNSKFQGMLSLIITLPREKDELEKSAQETLDNGFGPIF